MIRNVSRSLAVLVALALVGLAPLAARADDRHHGHGYRRYGHGHGHGHGHHGHGYYRVVTRWGVPYYYGAGAWYRPYGVGYVGVGAPLGVIVPYLPPYYTTVWYGGAPYYAAGGAYYQPVPGGYAVVAAPGAPAGPPPAYDGSYDDDEDEIFVYPQRGQSESRQSDDRYACHRWAVDQTGYDPTRALEGAEAASDGGSRSDYQRAMSACLEGRGYTVR